MENKIKIVKVALVERELYDSEIDQTFDIFMSYDYACSMYYDITNKVMICSGDNVHESGNSDFYNGYKYGYKIANPKAKFEEIEEIFICENNNTYCFDKAEKWLIEKYIKR